MPITVYFYFTVNVHCISRGCVTKNVYELCKELLGLSAGNAETSSWFNKQPFSILPRLVLVFVNVCTLTDLVINVF